MPLHDAGRNALPILTSNRHLDLMITDVGLPGLNGRQLAEIGRQHRPELKILFTSGYSETQPQEGGLVSSANFLKKPYRPADLAEKLRSLLPLTPV